MIRQMVQFAAAIVFFLTFLGIDKPLESAEQPAGSRPAPQFEVVFDEASVKPESVVWLTNNNFSIIGNISDSASPLLLDAFEGCLTLLRQGHQPVSVAITPSDGKKVQLDGIEWKNGSMVSGRILNTNAVPIAAVATLQPAPQPSKADKYSEEQGNAFCQKGLKIAGVSEAITNREGFFTLGPLSPGTHEISFSAEHHQSEARKVVCNKEEDRDMGEVALREIGVLYLVLDTSDVDEDPLFQVTVYGENPEGWIEQRNEWVELAKEETDGLQPLEFQLGTGLHRLVFSKAETEIFAAQLVHLLPGPNEVWMHPKPVFVSGVVRDGEGTIEGATLEFSCQGSHQTGSTDEDGRYEVGLWNAAPCAVFTSTLDGRMHAEKLDLRTVDLGDEVELDIEFPNSSISGTVVDAETREPISDCVLNLMQWTTDSSAQTSYPGRSDESGTFEFQGVRGDDEVEKSTISASHDGYLSETIEVYIPENGTAEEFIELRKSTEIKGRVVGPAGEPISNGYVGCRPDMPGGDLSVTTRSDSSGRFSLDATPGTMVFATAPGYTTGWNVALDDGEEVVIPLGARTNAVTVRVQGSEGTPIQRVVLTFSSPGSGLIPVGLLFNDAVFNHQEVMTDENGYLVSTALPPGMYRIWIMRASGPSEVGAVNVPSPGEVTLTID